MGRMYRPVEVRAEGGTISTVAILDTGADETVISQRVATAVGAELSGTFSALCASQTVIEGSYAVVHLRELWSGKEARVEVGVTDVPFDTDDIDEEGVNVILGVDFIQETGLVLSA